MKTATITWITYNNYGTLLQAYALQKKIEQLGHENMILYDGEILKAYRARKKETSQIKVIQGDSTTTGLLSRLMEIAEHPKRIRRSILARKDRDKYEQPYEDFLKLCEEFKKTELRIFENVTMENLSELNYQFDVFIAGSDQVWSVFDNNFNPYYYLEFATKKKIAYAPSLGTDRIPEKTSEVVKQLLSDFDAISVRENVSAEQLTKLTGRKIEWVADPTLLHTCLFWEKFTADIPVRKKKYLLCYFLENRKWYFEHARKLAKQLHLNIVLIPNKWDYLSSEYVIESGVGPKEFVSLIQHAEYVLTDSYHGSIFSLIFQRRFQYLLRFAVDDPNSQNIRVQSLFGYLELNDRIVTRNGAIVPKIGMEYQVINEKINALRSRSIRYLEESLKRG